jgi:rod shape determining protein RodA
MFLAGLPLRLFIGGGLVVAAAIPLVYSFLLLPHQRDRVLIFMNPETDRSAPDTTSPSRRSRSDRAAFSEGLPQRHPEPPSLSPRAAYRFHLLGTAEEWGLVGGSVLILFFFLLLTWGHASSRWTPRALRAADRAGLTLTIFFYIAINLMMVMGLAPWSASPSPRLLRRSAMLTVMICLGMLMSIDRDTRRNRRR